MSKVAIMQPYFFPYAGYFSLIKHVDSFILFDPVQFIRHGWIERNRVLKQNEGWIYVKAPLIKNSHETLIKDARVDNSQPWQQKLLAQLTPYKRLSRRYDEVYSLVETSLRPEYPTIVELDRAVLLAVCDYLGIDTPISVWSEMNLEIEPPRAPDEWALNTCKALEGVDEYWNPPGGQSFFDRTKYQRAGIDLKFHQVKLRPYDQRGRPFEPGLSIIDVLMFNSPEAVNEMLDDYDLL